MRQQKRMWSGWRRTLVAVTLALWASGCGAGIPGDGFYTSSHDGPVHRSVRHERERPSLRRTPRLARYGRYRNPTYHPRWVAEENAVAFRLRGESTWRAKFVSAPTIAEENERAFRRVGEKIWRRK